MNKLGEDEVRDGKEKEIYTKEEGSAFTRAFKEWCFSIRDMVEFLPREQGKKRLYLTYHFVGSQT